MPFGFAVIGNKALFAGFDATQPINELWVTDGTAGGTTELSPSGARTVFDGGLLPIDIVSLGSRAVFQGIDASGNGGLWVSDGTSVGTVELNPAGADPAGLYPASITHYGSEALFAGRDTNGKVGLWMTDGTSGGTSEIIAGDNQFGLQPVELAVLGDKVLFNGTDANGNTDLWVTDGTAAGTTQIVASGANASGLGPFYLTTFGNVVLFSGIGTDGRPTCGFRTAPRPAHMRLRFRAPPRSVSHLTALACSVTRCFSTAPIRRTIKAYGRRTAPRAAPSN